MIHRILLGQNADEVATDLLNQKQLSAAFDLAPYFVNCVRVLSLPIVNTPAQQEMFDDMLAEAGWQKGVQWTYDVGAYLRVTGRPIFADNVAAQMTPHLRRSVGGQGG
jgi:hypothetical protein